MIQITWSWTCWKGHMFSHNILKFQTFCFKGSYVINNLLKSCKKWDSFLSHCTSNVQIVQLTMRSMEHEVPVLASKKNMMRKLTKWRKKLFLFYRLSFCCLPLCSPPMWAVCVFPVFVFIKSCFTSLNVFLSSLLHVPCALQLHSHFSPYCISCKWCFNWFLFELP